VSQDEDPNGNRRKRRKTEKTKTDQETILQAGLSGWLGVEAPEPPAPAPIIDTQNAPPIANRQSPRSPTNPSGPVQDLSPKEQNEKNASDGSKRKVL
jgi:hypothetical protein